MKDLNRVILIGRLGTDPQRKESKGSVVYVQFPLATSRKVSRKEGSGEGEAARSTEEETQWHQVVVWGRQAELCAQYLNKGNTVFVEGSLRSRKYESKNGDSRRWFEVHADHVGFLSGGRRISVANEESMDAAAG